MYFCEMMKQGIAPEREREAHNEVLIVEQDALQAHLLEVTLREAGWAVRLADDPKGALLYCQDSFFDVAIINFFYPGKINGFVLAELLRTEYQLPSLMVTAARQMELNNHPDFNPNQELLFKPYRLFDCTRRLQGLLTYL